MPKKAGISLPPDIGNLSELRQLDLAGNRLTSLPGMIGELKKLTDLDLSDNRLITLPDEFNGLSGLSDLDLSQNQLAVIPSSIGALTKLTELDISSNVLESLPREIGNLILLTRLDLSENRITGCIPPQIGNLSNLNYLLLQHNDLEGEVPETITNLPVAGFHSPWFLDKEGLNIGGNHLYSGNRTVIDFLDRKDPDWQSSQACTRSVTTSQPSAVTPVSALSGGHISEDLGESVIRRGVCWNVSINPVKTDFSTEAGQGSGAFQCKMTGLFPKVTYHVRAYAETETQLIYGNEQTVTTDDVVISGIITDSAHPLEGVTVTFSHDGHQETTDADGRYSYVLPYSDQPVTTEILPSLPGGYTFEPETRQFDSSVSESCCQNFTLADDGDGVPGKEEFGPNGADPAYDGNSDGIADALQANAASLFTSGGRVYCTLSCPEGHTLSNIDVLSNDDLSIAKIPFQNSEFLSSFSCYIGNLEKGGATTLSLRFSGEQDVDTCWINDRFRENYPGYCWYSGYYCWYDFLYNGETGAEITPTGPTLHFIDGRLGDMDGCIDKSIQCEVVLSTSPSEETDLMGPERDDPTIEPEPDPDPVTPTLPGPDPVPVYNGIDSVSGSGSCFITTVFR